MLLEIAHVAAKTRNTYLAAQYRRLAARRGKKRALVALGHTILVIVYHILTRRKPYRELGVAYFDQLDRQRVEQRLVRRLERLATPSALSQPSPIGAWSPDHRHFQEGILQGLIPTRCRTARTPWPAPFTIRRCRLAYRAQPHATRPLGGHA